MVEVSFRFLSSWFLFCRVKWAMATMTTTMMMMMVVVFPFVSSKHLTRNAGFVLFKDQKVPNKSHTKKQVFALC